MKLKHRENNSVRLHRAVLDDDVQAVKKALKAGDVVNLRDVANLRDGNRNTPLHVAMTRQNSAIIELLLEHKANPSVRNYHDVTPLHLAAYKKNGLRSVALLLKSGAKTNCADRYGDTPLHIAAQQGNAETLEALLLAGANINAMNHEFQMPMSVAQRHRQTKCVQILLAHGATLESSPLEILKFAFRTLRPLVRLSLTVVPTLVLAITIALSALTSGEAVISIPLAVLAIVGIEMVVLGKQYYKIRALEKRLMNGEITFKHFLDALSLHRREREKVRR